MEKIELTEKEIKTLKLFSYYVQSQGCKEAECDLYFYDNGYDIDNYYLTNNWGCKKQGGKFEIYESIEELLTKIIEELEISDLLDEDEPGSGTLEISIDAVERKMEFRVFETVRINNEMGTSIEVTKEDYPEVEEFFKMLEDRGITQGEVTFDGGGDSGEISSYMSISGGRDEQIPAKVEDFLYNFLGNFYGGWEINEGSHGDFTFYIKTREVVLNFNEHSEDNEDRGKVLHIDF